MGTAGNEHETDGNPIDHRGLEVLSMEVCDQKIVEAAVGRVAFISRGKPVILPVTHRLSGNAIVFRTSHGEKLDAADRGEPAAFEVDDWDAETQTGWSVLVSGNLERVDDPDEIAELENLGLVSWAGPKFRDYWIRLRRRSVTGRELR